MNIRQELAQLLQTTEEKLDARLLGMRLAPVCGRCGGSGSYSFNQIDGSRCYGCNGRGVVTPSAKQLPRVLEDAKAAVEAGELETYLESLRAQQTAKNASKRIMNAWRETNVAKAKISHMVRSEEVEGLAEYRAANKVMADTYTNVTAAADKLNPRSETYREDVIKVAAMVEDGIKLIKETDYDLSNEFLARCEAWEEDFRKKMQQYREDARK